MEAYQQPTLVDKVTPGPWQYTAIWKITQRLTDKPVKFGAISVDSLSHMIRNEAYDNERDLLVDLADIANSEYRQLAEAGCPIIQIEEPLHHIMVHDADTDLDSPDRSLQSPGGRRQHRDLGTYLLGQPRPTDCRGQPLLRTCPRSHVRDEGRCHYL